MGTFLQDVRYGARLLVRFPSVTIAALVALALGTGVNTALFSIVNAVLLAPLPFPDSQRLVQVWRTELPRLQYGAVSYPRYIDWRARNRVFEESGAFAPAALTLTGRDAPERLPAGRVTASFFALSARRRSRAATLWTTRIALAARLWPSSASSSGTRAWAAPGTSSARR